MEKAFNLLFKLTVVVFVLMIAVQIGIYHGRKLERKEAEEEIKILKDTVMLLKAENKSLQEACGDKEGGRL